ncbi:D-ribose pyranase [Seminibacterium arietis]|uniref:D-ribose pyranase n=1 Tax=Seminibacterium arietis TaxID=1173502 RepID=A0ABW3I9N6_9PAST
MKKTIILNPSLSHTIASLGHTDCLTISDAGLPIPMQCPRIDLALTKNIPTFLQTIDAVVSEMFVERAVIAEEIKQKNPQILTALLQRIKQLEKKQNNNIAVEFVNHKDFKLLTHSSKAVVRTGEFSPYANVILYSGVPF